MNSESLSPVNCWCTLIRVLIVIILLSTGLHKVKAQSPSEATANPAYEGIYVVITSSTDKAQLESIQQKLKKWNIVFRATNLHFVSGQLTSITLDVQIPGVYTNSLSSGNEKDPLAEPVIFYHETSKGAGLSNGVPKEISTRGKSVVTDNLKGILIMYDGDNMESSGTFYTKWKSK